MTLYGNYIDTRNGEYDSERQNSHECLLPPRVRSIMVDIAAFITRHTELSVGSFDGTGRDKDQQSGRLGSVT